MTGYQRVCESVLLPLSDLILGQHVHSRFRELQRFQWLAAPAVAAHQAQRFRELVQFSASRVPYYRRVLQEHGLASNDFRDATDLPKLPVLDRRAIRECFHELQVEGYRGRTYEMKSSGSTGMQATALLDGACMSEVLATQLLFWSWGGFAMGQPHLQTGMSLNRGVVKQAKDLLFQCTYTSAFDLTDAKLAKVASDIERKGIRALFGYASSLYVIARYFDRHHPGRTMDAVFTWGDSLFPHYRETIERVFGCRVSDCYGLGEGLQCAAQCEEHGVLHEAAHGVIVEVVDLRGQPVPIGELGRVLVTRLEAGPMPLIRYDTGDVASFVAEPCSCGRALRGLSRIQGRATDIVTTPTGDRLIVHFFTQIFEMIPEIVQFQVVQVVPEGITIRVVPGVGFREELLEEAKRQILAACRYPLGIVFEKVTEIPLEKSNKRRFVVSSVPF